MVKTVPRRNLLKQVRGSYLHQHVEQPRRGNTEPSRLDLVFTDEAMQVTELSHHSTRCQYDHDVMTFEFQCYVEY